MGVTCSCCSILVKHAIVRFWSSKNIVWSSWRFAKSYGVCDVGVLGWWLVLFGDYATRDYMWLDLVVVKVIVVYVVVVLEFSIHICCRLVFFFEFWFVGLIRCVGCFGVFEGIIGYLVS